MGTGALDVHLLFMTVRWPYTTSNKRFVVLGERLRAFHAMILGRYFNDPEDILERAVAARFRDDVEIKLPNSRNAGDLA